MKKSVKQFLCTFMAFALIVLSFDIQAFAFERNILDDGTLNYVYVESAHLNTEDSSQNIVISYDGELDEDSVQLLATNEMGQPLLIDCVKKVDNLYLFSRDFTEEETGIYEVEKIIISDKDKWGEISMEEADLDISFDVYTEGESYIPEGVADIEDPYEAEEKITEAIKEMVPASYSANKARSVEEDTSEQEETGEPEDTDEPEEEFIVCLDPGHDEVSPGAQSHGYGEEDLVLEIAKYCREELEKEGVTVVMTREDMSCPAGLSSSDHPQNEGICLKKRVDIARDNNADIFVSLHLNASDAQSANGAEVYYANKNFRPELSEEGKDLAQAIQDELVDAGLTDRGIKVQDSTDKENIYPDGSRKDRLAVIRRCKEYGIPGVLVEHGFITNDGDVNEYLTTESGLSTLGTADAKGILNYREGYTGKKEYNCEWLRTNEGWVYVNEDGQRATGWQFINGYWYYMNGKGIMLTGWQLIGGSWYYLYSDGHMATGWARVGSTWYYMDSSGRMKTLWQYVNGYWYYLGTSGDMKTGWQLIGGSWYYLYSDGHMAAGWAKVGDTWYYTDSSGRMKTLWQYVNSEWYYLGTSGAMITGWKWINGSCYYFYTDGHMAADEITPDGFYVNASGAWVKDAEIDKDDTPSEETENDKDDTSSEETENEKDDTSSEETENDKDDMSSEETA